MVMRIWGWVRGSLRKFYPTQRLAVTCNYCQSALSFGPDVNVLPTTFLVQSQLRWVTVRPCPTRRCLQKSLQEYVSVIIFPAPLSIVVAIQVVSMLNNGIVRCSGSQLGQFPPYCSLRPRFEALVLLVSTVWVRSRVRDTIGNSVCNSIITRFEACHTVLSGTASKRLYYQYNSPNWLEIVMKSRKMLLLIQIVWYNVEGLS